MRAILLFLTSGFCLFLLERYPTRKNPAMKTAVQTLDTLNFKTTIQPIFEKHCSPCHFPGGKMYEKLPFDQGEKIVKHETGILKRIKGEEEVQLIQQYVEQQK